MDERLNHITKSCTEAGTYIGVIPGAIEQPTCAGLPDAEFITIDYEYDGNRNRTLVRLGEATNGNQPDNVVQTICDDRDLTFHVIRAPGLPGPGGQSTTQYDYDGNGNLTATRQGIEDAPRITMRAYDGHDRRMSTTDPMGNVSTNHYDANGNLTMYSFDPLDRLTARTHADATTHLRIYDDIYRLRHTTVTDAGAVTQRDTGYALDGVSNRTVVTGVPDSGPHVDTYTMDSTLPEPADSQVNQYTTVAAQDRTDDRNGNLKSILTEMFAKYDYRNRMVEYQGLATGERRTCAYDALGRRIAKVVDADRVVGGPYETHFLFLGSEGPLSVAEEQDEFGATQATYVTIPGGPSIIPGDQNSPIASLYIDEVLNIQRGGLTAERNSLGATPDVDNVDALKLALDEFPNDRIAMTRGGSDYYYHHDNARSTIAVTDAGGTVVEWYEYADFGGTRFFDGNGEAISDLAIANPYLFTGRRRDPETGWHVRGSRYLDSVAGRFTTRDTIGLTPAEWGDPALVRGGQLCPQANGIHPNDGEPIE